LCVLHFRFLRDVTQAFIAAKTAPVKLHAKIWVERLSANSYNLFSVKVATLPLKTISPRWS